ncbi:MAG TPA: hypothetical protein VHX68_15205 [Planctomycetaceae bacterium]|jgi:hypothetical protein|nr:hypothetical protein [Planctomycetaceae bacterium]
MLARLSKGEANVFDLAKLAGGGGSWTRLAEDLAKESSSKEKPAINRLRDVTPRFRRPSTSLGSQCPSWLYPLYGVGFEFLNVRRFAREQELIDLEA